MSGKDDHLQAMNSGGVKSLGTFALSDAKRTAPILQRDARLGDDRLDDNETRISGARRADVTGAGAWEPHVEDLALAKSLKSGNFTPAKAVIRWMSVCYGLDSEER